MYRIKYHYTTGDSFHTEKREDLLEYEWNDLDIAKECLKRIREHYRWYRYVERSNIYDEVKKPEWHKVKTEKILRDNNHCLINIPMDNGIEIQLWPPWVGYFELLHGAEIIVDEKTDNDMKFEL